MTSGIHHAIDKQRRKDTLERSKMVPQQQRVSRGVDVDLGAYLAQQAAAGEGDESIQAIMQREMHMGERKRPVILSAGRPRAQKRGSLAVEIKLAEHRNRNENEMLDDFDSLGMQSDTVIDDFQEDILCAQIQLGHAIGQHSTVSQQIGSAALIDSTCRINDKPKSYQQDMWQRELQLRQMRQRQEAEQRKEKMQEVSFLLFLLAALLFNIIKAANVTTCLGQRQIKKSAGRYGAKEARVEPQAPE